MLLRGVGIAVVADVRRVPRSRRHPHFAGESLARSLPEAGIRYEHLPELGGWRRPRPDSVNVGWRVDMLRGYADHMDSEEFLAGIARLEELGRAAATATMCAEAQPFRCHRNLLADALVARGWQIRHIWPDGRQTDHELPDFAEVDGGRVTYPAAQQSLDL